jgi:regulator of nucleoside diphosphate kinase
MPSMRTVLVGQRDRDRIHALLQKSDSEHAELLFDEIDAATVVADHLVPSDVVAMNTRITFIDLDTTVETTIELVYPHEVNRSSNCVSVLAPVGAALIGLRVGDTIEWPLPNNRCRRIKVLAVEGA